MHKEAAAPQRNRPGDESSMPPSTDLSACPQQQSSCLESEDQRDAPEHITDASLLPRSLLAANFQDLVYSESQKDIQQNNSTSQVDGETSNQTLLPP